MLWTKSPENRSKEAARERSGMIDKQLKREREGMHPGKIVDILLFEPEESNTAEDMLKEMSISYGSDIFSMSERRAFTAMVFVCILEKIRLVLEAVSSLELSIAKDNQVHNDCILSLGIPSFDTDILPENISNALRSLVKDNAVSETLDRAAEWELEPTDADTASYFFGAIERIADPAYLPSDQDILRTRTTIPGNKATILKIGDITYRLCNMHGQWQGLRKWIHHFEGMKAVMLLVDLSMYDYHPVESLSNYIEDAIDMFDVLCNTESFTDSAKILFLRTDGLEEKLLELPLAHYFPDYSGRSYDSACVYLRKRFVSVKRGESKTVIYAHLTTKTNIQQMKFMMQNAVHDVLLRKYLRENDLI